MMRKTSTVVLLSLIVYGCNVSDLEFKKIKALKYEPKVAIPIGTASYTVGELIEDIEDEKLETVKGDNFSLTFIYRDSSHFKLSDEFVDFGEIVNDTARSLQLRDSPPQGLPSPINNFELPETTFAFEFPESTGGDLESNGGDLIDSIFYRSAQMEIKVENNSGVEIEHYEITLEGTRTRKGGRYEDFKVDGSVSPRGTQTKERSLAGYQSTFTNNNGKNTFNAVLKTSLNAPAGTRTSKSDNLRIRITISDIEIAKIYGNFGSTSFGFEERSISLDFFEDFSGGLKLGNPKLQFEVRNEYGIPVSLDLTGMTAVNKDGHEKKLTAKAGLPAGEIGVNDIRIKAPAVLGETAITPVEISKENSNIQEFLNIIPTSIKLPITGQTNPDGAPAAGTNNFLKLPSTIEVAAAVEIPLNVSMEGFSTEIDFDISDFDIEGAESMTIRVISTNQMPIKGSVTFRIEDDQGRELHSINDQAVILESPTVESDGRVETPRVHTEDIVLDKDAIDAFINGSKVVAVVHVDSFVDPDKDAADEDTFVNIYSDYKLDFELSLSGDIAIQVDLSN